ncbi:undecaprenyldiphospho-muramoylpentapeptide beta-N-acetylglucosaminyltransferase [Candidatus Bipolaricaulota bacterium]|nr:undecaprenyldiphospho-muramoylpentapeptide beta-N-acetylglucosaminyltransferase [Candidatus Bipolaricaulota bacterium]
MRVLVTGGGTGGHFYPALTVMKKLHEEDQEHNICYVGTGKGLESKIAPRYDWLDFKKITVTGLSRQSALRFLKGLFLLPVGILQTLLIVRRFKPDVIYGTGGYTTFPPAFWGVLLRIPVLTHELNLKPGITNKILARYVTKVLTSYRETEEYLPDRKTKTTGTPVRREINSDERSPTGKSFGLKPDSPIILVFGGSQGSRVLIEKTISEIEERGNTGTLPYQFLVQTGSVNYSAFAGRVESLETERVRLIEYIEDMGSAYRMSDLVICRGGAGTMAELVATKTPAIIVPWSGASENHQYFNGKYLADNGASLLVEEEDWSGFSLFRELSGLFTHSDKLEEMSNNYQRLDFGEGTEEVIKSLKDTISEGE